jgi:hypothetical protein
MSGESKGLPRWAPAGGFPADWIDRFAIQDSGASATAWLTARALAGRAIRQATEIAGRLDQSPPSAMLPSNLAGAGNGTFSVQDGTGILRPPEGVMVRRGYP